jgi:hypothetical protein
VSYGPFFDDGPMVVDAHLKLLLDLLLTLKRLQVRASP